MKLACRFFVLVFVLTLFSLTSFAQIYEWRGPNRSGVYQEDNLLKKWPTSGPELLWEKNGIGFAYSSATVTKETVYVTGRKGEDDVLTALTLDGAEKWSMIYGKAWTRNFDGTRSTPTVVGDRIYLISGVGDMVCVNSDGKMLWSQNHYKLYDSKPVMFGVSESPLYVDDKIIASPGGSKASLVAFNAANGEVVWEAEPLNEGPLYVNPLLINHKGRKIIVTNTNMHIIGVDATNGKLLWKVNYDETSDIGGRSFKNHANTPIYHDGKIFVAAGHKFVGIQLVLSDDGSAVELGWKNKDINTHLGGMVLIDGYLYSSNFIHNSMGNWVCVDWETGETKWSTKWYNKGSIISDGEMLYLFEEKFGHLALANINSERLDIVSEFKINIGKGQYWSHPVIGDGKLYIRHGETLQVYSIKQ